jgi:hypothetical protein
MTPDQMLAYDKRCYPFALLTSYLLWASRKWHEWGQSHPGAAIYSVKETGSFEKWLEELVPKSDALTCECHVMTKSDSVAP